MKNLLALTCVATMAVMACGPEIKLADRPQFSNGVNTYTFLVYDAFTGVGIEDATIKLSFGSYSFNAVHQTGNSYVVSQMPPSGGLATIEAPNHLGFLGQPNGVNGALSSPSSQNFTLYQVALYPSTAVQNDVVVRAFESNKGTPVKSGTVVATLIGSNNLGTNFSNPLPGSLTLRPSTVVATLDPTGTATLPKGSLVLGGVYSIDVFGAVGTSGAYLTPAQNVTTTVGDSPTEISLFMGPPALAPVAVTVNNEDPSKAVGSLQVTFPFPVEQCDNSKPTWALTGSDVNGDGILATPDPIAPVTTNLSTDGMSLTLTPKTTSSTTFQPADGPLYATFNNVVLRVRGTTTCQALTNIQLRNTGSTVDTTIMVVAAP